VAQTCSFSGWLSDLDHANGRSLKSLLKAVSISQVGFDRVYLVVNTRFSTMETLR
jgi:hypothetical protein